MDLVSASFFVSLLLSRANIHRIKTMLNKFLEYLFNESVSIVFLGLDKDFSIIFFLNKKSLENH